MARWLRVPGLSALSSLLALLLWTGSGAVISGCAGDGGSGAIGGGAAPALSEARGEVPGRGGEERKEPERAADSRNLRRSSFRVLRSYPHDPRLYTQGLLWWEGLLYESTGRYGRSALLAWDPETGEVRDRADLPPELFGEGLARVGDELIQLTWRNGVALRWSPRPFQRIGNFRYSGEGWGLAFDGERLIMSHGSGVLTIRDPETFEILERLSVTLAGEPVSNLNELEAAEGWIFANVWTSEEILRIDPGTGVVTAVIDASGLLSPSEARGVDVLNGIAYRADTDTFFVTGKLWPRIFEGTFGENDSR